MSWDLIKDVDRMIDDTFEYTGLPKLAGGFAGLVGQGVDTIAGTNIAPTVEKIGHDLPRTIVEGALTIPEAATGVGAPLAAATWASRLRKLGQIAGYSGAAIKGTATTDSALGGLISAGSMGLGNKLLLPATHGGLDVGGAASRKLMSYLSRETPDIVAAEGANLLASRPALAATTTAQRFLPGAARVGTDVAAMTGLNEATRQASMSVGPNAVPLDAPERNPLTPENVAGAVTGGLMFAPQAIHAVVNRPRLVPKQVTQMKEWIDSRRQAQEAYRGYDWEGPVTPEAWQDTFGTMKDAPAFRGRDQVPIEEYWTPENFGIKLDEAVNPPTRDFLKLHTSLRTQLDALRSQNQNGDAVLAEKTRQSIANILEGMPVGEGDPMVLREAARTLDAQARQMPPEDAKGMVKFVQDLNGLIDQINEQTHEGSEELKNEKSKGQYWHPEARSSIVTQRLQDRGLLPKIDAEWLKNNFNAEFDQSGNAQFSYHVVLQKAANLVFDSLPKALEQEGAVRPAVTTDPTELSTRAQKRYAKLDNETVKFIDALNNLPEEVKDQVVARTAEVFAKQPYIANRGQMSGRLVGIESSWRKAVIRAMESYDPVSQTSLLWNKETRTFVRRPLKYLFLRDENGNYLWSPATSAVPVAEGGKPKVKGRPEANLEEIVQEGRSPDEVLDEDTFKAALAQEGIGGSLQSKTEAGLGTGQGGVERAPEVVGDVPSFLSTPEQKAKADAIAKNQKVVKALAELNDDQLYRASADVFARKVENAGVGSGGDVLRGYRRAGGLRAALEAIRENFATMGEDSTPIGPAGKKFLEMEAARGLNLAPPEGRSTSGYEKKKLRVQLLSFFKAQDTKTMLENVGKVVEKITDEKVQRMVKGGTEPRATGGTEPVEGAVSDKYVGTPGAFTPDLVNALRTKFSQVLGTQGYAGTLRDLYTEMAVALAQQLDRVPTDFYSIVGKEWGLANTADGRGKLGLRLDETPANDPNAAYPSTEATKYVNRVLAVLAHEVSHIDSFVLEGLIDAPDAFSEERRRHLENLRDLGRVLNQDEREAILKTLRDGLWPKEAQYDVKVEQDGRMYGSHDPDEFVSTVNEMIFGSLLHGKASGIKNVLEVLDFSPTEVREFARGTYRTIQDVLTSLKDTIADPSIREYVNKPALPQTNPFITSEAFHAVVNAAREGSLLRESDKALAQARATFASMSPGAAGAPPMTSPALWVRTGKDIQENYQPGSELHARAMPSETAKEAVKAVADYFRPTDKTQPGVWARWFYPFQNLMLAMERSGVLLARPVANLALDLQAGITRTRTAMLRPFLIQGSDGKYHFDQENLLLKKVSSSKSGPWRDAVNEISAWQQEQGSQPMFVKSPDGTVTVNTALKGASEKWDAVRKGLSQEDAQVVQAASVALDEVGQIAAQRLVATLDVSNRHRVAALLMTMHPGMTYDNAMQVSDVVVGSLLRGDVSSVTRTGLGPAQVQQLQNFLVGPEGLLGKFKEVSDHLLSRPGFRTESLPGDYVVRFTTPERDVRFLSADSKSKAAHLARRLEREGNSISGEIVHKDQLRDYTDFDAPDTLLAKFVDVENAAWQRFIRDVESNNQGLWSQEMIQQLRSFTPGAETSRELGTKGLNKYLTQRESRVDRSRYDYIDGALSWVGRLATSMEYKTTRQMKDLILADPRAKAFPSFRGLVEPTFENLMTPTGQGAKELKAFATAYMMGGSLASVLINGTQSAVTLVPTLIQLGKDIGPVGAYKLLSKSIVDAGSVSFGSKWQQLATEAAKADPTKWSLEQAKAYYYKKSIEDGGINHGIIQDNIFTPTDQRTVLTAKFGHGDYGPATVGEMARSGVYTASQLALKPFGWIESFNNKISLFAGLEQGWEKGLRGEALYDHAKLVKVLSTYGGGKANVPGLVPRLSTPYTRSAVGVVNTLQQYGYGVVATYAQLLKDSLGQSQALSPLERRQAQKALGTMLATQVAVGGALGLPFAAATLTVLEKVFGVPANQLVREGLASLSDDDSTGATIAETALNGLGNQMFGVDVASRMGVSNLAGTSSYRGFNLEDMVGPVGSIVKNAGEALNWFGQAEPMKGAKALVPNSLKTLVDLTDSKAKYGDYGIRDAGDNLLYQPTPSQAALYLLGFRPREVSEKRQAQRLLTFANERASKGRGSELDGAARDLLSGNPGTATMLSQNARFADPTVDPKAILRSVVQRAVDSSTEKDLLASGPSSNEGERTAIAGTFRPGVVTRQSETARAQLAMQLGMQVGLEPDQKAMQKAVMVDGLVRTKGMPRSQALRLVEFLQ